MSDATRDFFDTLSKVLLRCWIFGFILLLFWFEVYLLAGEAIYHLHRGIFGLSKHELDVIIYCGIGLTKIIVILFFFIPWLGIRLVLRKAKTK